MEIATVPIKRKARGIVSSFKYRAGDKPPAITVMQAMVKITNTDTDSLSAAMHRQSAAIPTAILSPAFQLLSRDS